jgi:hypothetical protein
MLEAVKINRLILTSFQRPTLRLLYLVKSSESGEAVLKFAGKMLRKILNWHGSPGAGIVPWNNRKKCAPRFNDVGKDLAVRRWESVCRGSGYNTVMRVRRVSFLSEIIMAFL